MERFSYESTEPFRIPVLTDVEPNGSTVKAILIPTGNNAPDTADAGWITGTWQQAHQQGQLWKTDVWFTLTAHDHPRGVKDVYLWIDGTTHDPVLKVGNIAIY